MSLMFEVAEGGFLDIDVRIEGKTFKIVIDLKFLKDDLFTQVLMDVQYILVKERAMENTHLPLTMMVFTNIASQIK